MGLKCTKSLAPVCFAVSLPDSPEKNEFHVSASPNDSHSALSAPGSPPVSENKSKASNKRNKDISPVDAGKKGTSIFSTLGHKLTKTKQKAVPTGTFHVPPVADVTTSGSVEDGFVLVHHKTDTEQNQGKPCFKGTEQSHSLRLTCLWSTQLCINEYRKLSVKINLKWQSLKRSGVMMNWLSTCINSPANCRKNPKKWVSVAWDITVCG